VERKTQFTVNLLLAFLLVFLTSCQEVAPNNKKTIDPGDGTFIQDPDDTEEEKEEDETRPTGQITFAKGFCVCAANKQTILNDCSAFCADKSDPQEYLYADFNLGTEITESKYANLQGWCTVELPSAPNPTCQMEYIGDNGDTGYITSNIEYLDDDSIKVNLAGQLEENVTYILKLVETSSGASTNSIQVRKAPDYTEVPFLGPLRIVPVHQYMCMSLGIAQDSNNGDIFFQTAFPLHFYYVNNNTPPTIPPGVNNIYCHDVQLHGTLDNPIYPRLDLREGVFSFWNESDPRFYDLDKNGNMDIHDEIAEIVTAKGVNFDPANNKIFLEFSWPNFPYNAVPQAPGGNAAAPAKLGYIMTPWIDQTTFKAYCPGYSHYYGNNEVFKAMKDLIGVETEGLYLAVKEPETTTDEQGNVTMAADDYLLINEGTLKKIWFYIDNGQKIEPDTNTVANNTVHFHWPPDPDSPYIKKSSQKLYTVRHPQDLSGSPASDNTELRQDLRPDDKRFACIPKTE
jgi:hypothetical protein